MTVEQAIGHMRERETLTCQQKFYRPWYKILERAVMKELSTWERAVDEGSFFNGTGLEEWANELYVRNETSCNTCFHRHC